MLDRLVRWLMWLLFPRRMLNGMLQSALDAVNGCLDDFYPEGCVH